MHGSLLPRYRGRAPVNWAVLHGERETGATLHYMTEKPDAGDIVAQSAVPILPDDTAREVFDKVTVAAEIALDGVLPALIAGTAPRVPQDLAAGVYFGGRRPEDGTHRLEARRGDDPQSRARSRAALSRRPHDRGRRAGARAAHARARSGNAADDRRRRSKSATAGSSPDAAAAERSQCSRWSSPARHATRRRSSRASATRRCRCG